MSFIHTLTHHKLQNTVAQSQWYGWWCFTSFFLGTVKIHNKYTIANSTFHNSAGKCVTSPLNVYKSYFCERGGGVHIVVFDNVLRNSNITLFNNTLEGNSAVFGGGALVCLSGSTSGNTIQILHNRLLLTEL